MSDNNFNLPDPLFFFDAQTAIDGTNLFAIMEKNEFGSVVGGTMFMAHNGEQTTYCGDVEWVAVTTCASPAGMMVIGGSDGEVAYVNKTSVREDRLPVSSGREFTLRRLTVINGSVVAVGYGGSFFVLDDRLNWSERVFCQSSEASWIESIDLDSQGVRHLAGLNGEYWSDRSGEFELVPLPSNADFSSVCCGTDGRVYICGSTGALLIGEDDTWTVIDPPANLQDDFWRVVEFDGKIWVSSINHVFEWRGDELLLSDFGASFGIKNYFNLHGAENGLTVVDEKEILVFDGNEGTLVAEAGGN